MSVAAVVTGAIVIADLVVTIAVVVATEEVAVIAIVVLVAMTAARVVTTVVLAPTYLDAMSRGVKSPVVRMSSERNRNALTSDPTRAPQSRAKNGIRSTRPALAQTTCKPTIEQPSAAEPKGSFGGRCV